MKSNERNRVEAQSVCVWSWCRWRLGVASEYNIFYVTKGITQEKYGEHIMLGDKNRNEETTKSKEKNKIYRMCVVMYAWLLVIKQLPAPCAYTCVYSSGTLLRLRCDVDVFMMIMLLYEINLHLPVRAGHSCEMMVEEDWSWRVAIKWNKREGKTKISNFLAMDYIIQSLHVSQVTLCILHVNY